MSNEEVKEFLKQNAKVDKYVYRHKFGEVGKSAFYYDERRPKFGGEPQTPDTRLRLLKSKEER